MQIYKASNPGRECTFFSLHMYLLHEQHLEYQYTHEELAERLDLSTSDQKGIPTKTIGSKRTSTGIPIRGPQEKWTFWSISVNWKLLCFCSLPATPSQPGKDNMNKSAALVITFLARPRALHLNWKNCTDSRCFARNKIPSIAPYSMLSKNPELLATNEFDMPILGAAEWVYFMVAGYMMAVGANYVVADNSLLHAFLQVRIFLRFFQMSFDLKSSTLIRIKWDPSCLKFVHENQLFDRYNPGKEQSLNLRNWLL